MTSKHMQHLSWSGLKFLSVASIFLSFERIFSKCFNSISLICFPFDLRVLLDTKQDSKLSMHFKRQQIQIQTMHWITIQIDAANKTQLFSLQFVIDKQKSSNIAEFQSSMLIKTTTLDTLCTYIHKFKYLIKNIMAVSYRSTVNLITISDKTSEFM